MRDHVTHIKMIDTQASHGSIQLDTSVVKDLEKKDPDEKTSAKVIEDSKKKVKE